MEDGERCLHHYQGGFCSPVRPRMPGRRPGPPPPGQRCGVRRPPESPPGTPRPRSAPRPGGPNDRDIVGRSPLAAAGFARPRQPAGRPARSRVSPVLQPTSQFVSRRRDAGDRASPRTRLRVAAMAAGEVVSRASSGAASLRKGSMRDRPRHLVARCADRSSARPARWPRAAGFRRCCRSPSRPPTARRASCRPRPHDPW